MRTCAQLVSYEVSLALSVLGSFGSLFLASGLLVLSPEPARAFVDAVLARSPGAREVGGEALAAGAPAPGWTRWLPAAVVAGALLAVAATLGAAWARAPRSIRVEGGEVVVERNRWSPARIPLARRPHRLLPGRRTCGRGGAAPIGVYRRSLRLRCRVERSDRFDFFFSPLSA